MGKRKKMTVALALLICLMLLTPAGASAESMPKVELTADSGSAGTKIAAGGRVNVRIEVKSVDDLFGVELKLEYDSSKLRLASNGDIVPGGGFHAWVKDIDNGAGQATLAMTRQTLPPAHSESLTIATASFTAMTAGQAAIALSDVKLVNSVPRRITAGTGEDLRIVIDPQGGVPGGGDVPGGYGGGGTAGFEDDPLRTFDLTGKGPNEIRQWGVNLIRSISASQFARDKERLYLALTNAIRHLSSVAYETTAVGSGDAAAVRLKPIAMAERMAALNAAINSYNEELARRGWSKLQVDAGGTMLLTFGRPASTLHRLQLELSAADLARLVETGKALHLELPQLSLRLPPGAVPLASYLADLDRTSYTLTAVKLDRQQAEARLAADAGYKETGVMYSFSLEAAVRSAAASLPRIERILRPDVSISIAFKWPAEAVKASEAHKLGVYRYDEEEDKWTYAGGYVRGDEIHFRLKQFGNYAVMSYGKPFEDVGTGHWAAKDIELLTARQIVTGMDDRRFAPELSVTRAQFAAMLVRALGIEHAPGGVPSGFRDVPEQAWQAEAIRAATDAGLVQGVGGGRFEPDGIVTRQQMVVMLLRAYRYMHKEVEPMNGSAIASAYKDVSSISVWARQAVDEASRLGLLQGMPDGTFAPVEAVKRAQAAVVVGRLLRMSEAD
ncbi:S-layer homology domain-containing protein [Cohnella sp.]|uniref:S-layer homology domain-containing protein n=1 Tax=Cohnella sp. TaxID=1883426 RepID=UPI0035629C08